MNENNIKAGEWFEKAKHDFEGAKLIIAGGGYTDTAVVLLQQAFEKCLKGFLISKGWRLIKTHNLKYLLDESVKHCVELEKYYDLAIKLTKYYIDEKYPPLTSDISLDEVKQYFEETQAAIELLKKLV
jgi:HEPN domain-containing protein